MATKRPRGTPVNTSITQMLIEGEWANYRSISLTNPGDPQRMKGPKRPSVMDVPFMFNNAFGLDGGVEPGAEQHIDFNDLRGFADEDEVARLVIETCKDQLCKLRWTWRKKPKPGQTLQEVKDLSENDPDIKFLNNFFKFPDKEHDFSQWLRILLEELLVCGISPVWLHENNFNKPYALRIIDTATLKRCVNDMGVAPEPTEPYPGNVAYEQYIKGIKTSEFTTDELIYYIKNPRAWAFYSYSPIAQIILSLSTGMQRMAMQLAHYTDGNIPAMFMKAPKEWGLEQIKAWQLYWNELLSGNFGELSKGFLIPGEMDPVFPQKEVLKDEYDEWHARIICYGFSVSPNAFIKNLNRATSEQAREQADEEGLQARMHLVQGLLETIQEKWFGFEDIEFHFQLDRPQDSLKQAEIDNIYIRAGVKSVDEVRRELGMPAIGAPNRVYTTNGYMPLTKGDKPQFDIFRQQLERSEDIDADKETKTEKE